MFFFLHFACSVSTFSNCLLHFTVLEGTFENLARVCNPDCELLLFSCSYIEPSDHLLSSWSRCFSQKRMLQIKGMCLPADRTWSRNHGETLLTDSFSVSYSTDFLKNPGTTCLGMVLLTVGSAFPHELSSFFPLLSAKYGNLPLQINTILSHIFKLASCLSWKVTYVCHS